MIGDITLGATLVFPWPTSIDGVPTAVVGGTIAAYIGASAVPITGGLTWTPNVNGPGDNLVTVVATSGNGYAVGQDVTIKLTAGTLGGTSIAPRAIAYLSVQHRSAATPAQVNDEVVDALTVDTYAEPASAPSTTASVKDKLSWLFALGRQKVTQTSTTQTLRNAGDTADTATATVSDDGTTFVRDEWV